ncbi:hypothetical protein GCM10022254_11760 [Actinomadura meridiana]|uniref:RNA-binding protein n=1 Tax=Actinomadura meridiana TaxID=559626 RepID=A0ABP8BUS8_9ACTN
MPHHSPDHRDTMTNVLRFGYRVTKYDPADRDEQGRYIGDQDSTSDHGPIEAAYLEAVATFAAETGVQRLCIREPELSVINFGLEPTVPGHGLTGLFPDDLSGYHDGAEVPMKVWLELVRAMLRDNGAWCRLEAEHRFSVHVGYDQYLYIGSDQRCERAVTHTRALGLFPERIDRSPYGAETNEPGQRTPADDTFWGKVTALVATGRAGLLEENPIEGVSRWHRLDDGGIDRVRERLTPRARVAVWPSLSGDPVTVLASLSAHHLVQLVWEDQDGHVRATITDAPSPRVLDGARAATAISCVAGEQPPLLAAVLPDQDGVLRARWGTEPDQEHHRPVPPTP